MSSLSAWFVMYFVFPLCIFKPAFRLSEFKLFGCFSVCFVVSLKGASSSVNLQLVRSSPSTLTPSEMSPFLNCCIRNKNFGAHVIFFSQKLVSIWMECSMSPQPVGIFHSRAKVILHK